MIKGNNLQNINHFYEGRIRWAFLIFVKEKLVDWYQKNYQATIIFDCVLTKWLLAFRVLIRKLTFLINAHR